MRDSGKIGQACTWQQAVGEGACKQFNTLKRLVLTPDGFCTQSVRLDGSLFGDRAPLTEEERFCTVFPDTKRDGATTLDFLMPKDAFQPERQNSSKLYGCKLLEYPGDAGGLLVTELAEWVSY